MMSFGVPEVLERYPTYRDKQNLFFIDHEFVPLLVQESYLNSFEDKEADDMDTLEKMADASDFISHGDLLNTAIRKDQNWSLLPDYASMSSVAPCLRIKGKLNFPTFPQFFPKSS